MQRLVKTIISHCLPLNFKGNIVSMSLLPTYPKLGDMYNISDTENSIQGDDYYFDGNTWQKLDSVIGIESITIPTLNQILV